MNVDHLIPTLRLRVNNHYQSKHQMKVYRGFRCKPDDEGYRGKPDDMLLTEIFQNCFEMLSIVCYCKLQKPFGTHIKTVDVIKKASQFNCLWEPKTHCTPIRFDMHNKNSFTKHKPSHPPHY